MKIGWKIRKLWHFEISQIFKKHFVTSQYEMSELMSSPHNFPFILYTEMTKNSYFSYENVRLALITISWYEGHTITSLGKILKFSQFYVQNIWQVVRQWHHQLTHLHIHIDWSRNVSRKFAKLENVITSLFFNRFSSGFHYFVWNVFLFLL